MRKVFKPYPEHLQQYWNICLESVATADHMYTDV